MFSSTIPTRYFGMVPVRYILVAVIMFCVFRCSLFNSFDECYHRAGGIEPNQLSKAPTILISTASGAKQQQDN